MARPTTRLILGIVAIIGIGVVVISLFNREEPVPAFPHGIIRIATDTSYPPYSQDIGGELIGIDIDLGRALGVQLGLPVQFIPLGIDALYDALINDHADLIISALSPDYIMMSDVRYSIPYFNAGQVMVSNQKAPIEDWEGVSGKRIAHEFGAEADELLRVWSRRIRPFTAMPYELPEYALDALRLGISDGALVDVTTLGLYLQHHPNWEIYAFYVTYKPYTIAVRIDRVQTFMAVDAALKTFITTGTLAELIGKWLIYANWD